MYVYTQEPNERLLGYIYKTFHKNIKSLLRKIWDCSYDVNVINSLQALLNNKEAPNLSLIHI